MDMAAPGIDPASILGRFGYGFNIHLTIDYEFRKAQAPFLLKP
jgi:hypothetical protein